MQHQDHNHTLQETLNEDAPWWQALNPAIYLVSILPLFGVILLADTTIWLEGVVIATVGVVFLQHAINLFNDVSDWRKGADVEKYDSWVRVFRGNTQLVSRHAVISLVTGISLGLIVLFVSGKLWLLLIGVPLLYLGYLYNAGSRPLSYTALGEWVTGLCYGPGVFGCLYLLSHDSLTVPAVLGMFTFACIAMALLLSHQPPQITTDRQAGKHSFAVRYGKDVTITTARYLLVSALLAFLIAMWLVGETLLAYCFALLMAIALFVIFRNIPNPKSLLLSVSAVFAGSLAIQMLLSVVPGL
jgi:1,4-dihydroxy-2-naphthoate octaprenyltransferase